MTTRSAEENAPGGCAPGVARAAEDAFERRLARDREAVERQLDEFLPPASEFPPVIHEAIRYAALGGGKLVRPVLAREAARSLGLDPEEVSRAACAVEYVHASSLVLDDLPSMDDAATRRGRPTVHRRFGVATAILAADGLLMHAFRLVADNGVEAGTEGSRLAAVIRDLATAVGSCGMVGGQHVDLESTRLAGATPEVVEYVQSRKTAPLFVVACTIGGMLHGAPDARIEALASYARNVGLAYQIVDDILDAEGDPGTLGKDVGQDANKPTFVTLRGLDGARSMAEELAAEAGRVLRKAGGETSMMESAAAYCVRRLS